MSMTIKPICTGVGVVALGHSILKPIKSTIQHELTTPLYKLDG
jgi:hypothetical protein